MNRLETGLHGQQAMPLRRSADMRIDGWFTTAFASAYLMMLCGTFYMLFSTATTAGQITEKAGSSATYMIFWLALYAGLVFELRRELVNPVNLFMRNKLFGLFLLSAILSYVFCPPATQLVATKMFMFTMTLLFGLFLARNFTMERFFSLFITLSAAVLIVHWLIYPIQSKMAYDTLDRVNLIGTLPYGGLFPHKNLAGTFFGLAFMACYARAMVNPRRMRYAALAAGHAFALVIAGAASALLCAAIGAAIMTGAHLYARRSRYAAFFLIAAAAVLVAVLAVGTGPLLNAVGRDAGMSGRWRVFGAWPQYFWQHPFFGWGYSNFFTGVWNEPAVGLRTLTPYHAPFFTFESAYLELAIDFGLIGCGLFFAMMAVGFRNAVRLARRDDVRFCTVPLGWLVFIAAMSVSDSGLRIHNLVTAAIVAWTYFGLPVGRRLRTRLAPVRTSPASLLRRPVWTSS